jgi:hypothetical protein
MQDISEIKKELLGFEEIELPHLLKKDKSYLKYITIINDEEFFFDGGYFQKMGNDKIFFKKGKQYKNIQTVYKKPCGEILYKTRFFISEEEGYVCLKDKKELEKIIKTQQEVIEKMTQKLEKSITLLTEEKDKNKKYENYIRENFPNKNN